ncbi:MAG: aldehyde dehydrogenase family protein [bacterium]|nr:aldehyde dehydrogenase family protein [bacterium]
MDTKKIRSFLGEPGYAPAPESDKKVRQWLADHGNRFGHYIDGEWQAPQKGEYFLTVNPARPSDELARVALGTEADIDKAMVSAQKAFSSWSKLSGFERAKYLYAIARSVAKNARLFAVLESLDNGKTIRETRDADIPLVIRHFHYHAGWAELLEKEFPNHRPGGVISQIIPWNFPFLMVAWKIAPALAAGNTVVLKPSKYTPLTALLFAEILMKEVRLPPGVVNIVTGEGGKTGALMVKHPIPWKIAFTGSTDAGRKIRMDSAGSGKKLTLELGGKSPIAVFANADLDSAVEGVDKAIWFNQGEVCCAGSRLLIEEKIYGDFVQRLKARMNRLRCGNPLDKTMDMGPINNSDQLKKIKELVEIGKQEGATMWQPKNWLCESKETEGGYFFPPTIFTDVEPAHTIAQEEFFGPVLVCLSFRTPEEAVELANNTRYGLAASVWSQDINYATDVAKQIKAGTVWINDANLFDAGAGFGGYRESGYGREGGREGMYEVMKERADSSPKKDKECQPVWLMHSREEIDRTYRFLIGGKLARPDGATSFPILSPDDHILGVVGDANRKDVRNAVEAARKAASGWENATAHLRSQILYFLAENLAVQKERFEQVIARQTSCSFSEAGEEVKKSIERLFYYAAYCDKFEGTVQQVPGKMLVVGVKEPMGVLGVRAPDEYPLLGVISTLAPAIAMGNSVVLVAGKYPLSAMDLIQVIQNSDVPAGVVNILTAADPDAMAKVLAEHEDVDAMWHFGSAEGSKAIEEASIGNMKRTWVSNGKPLDWAGSRGESKRFLREATQVKNIWVPFGVGLK